MKIVFNTDQIYLHGGIEKVMATKANYFANEDGVEVFIITTEQNQNAACYRLDPQIKLIDLEINYNRSKSYFSRENLLKTKQHFSRQRKLLEDLKPDFIISCNFNFDHYWLPFIKNKAKLLKERHGSGFFENECRRNAGLLEKFKFKVNDYVDSLYDKIIVLNPDEKSYVRSNNAVVIPNPVEKSLLRADYSKKQVIAAGRIAPVKGFDDLIEAWAIVYQDFPEWKLHFYGQDYLGTQKKLEELIDQYELGNAVQFKGSVEDLTKKMTEYSVYAMTSETECFPMVLLESLSVGLPVISYDSPTGPKHILKNEEDSLLVSYKNLDIFAEKLKHLMENEDIRQKMGENGIKNVQRFSIEIVMNKWKDLFASLI